jgi:hypothetical protein
VLLIAAAGLALAAATRWRPASGEATVAGGALILAVLALRAATVIGLAAVATAALAQAPWVAALRHRCFDVAGTHLHGHHVAVAALVVPGAAILLSVGVACLTGLRARALGATLLGLATRRPDGIAVVPSHARFLAVLGTVRPTVTVSTGALDALDADELRAGLQHERAHVERRHRWVLLGAHGLAAASWPLPGREQLLRRLVAVLERDADRHAVRRGCDRFALAGAICKCAQAPAGTGAGDGDVVARVRALIDDPRPVTRATRRMTVAGAAGAGALSAALVLAGGAATHVSLHGVVRTLAHGCV